MVGHHIAIEVVDFIVVADLGWSTVLDVAHKSRLCIIQHVRGRTLFVGVVEARSCCVGPVSTRLFVHHYQAIVGHASVPDIFNIHKVICSIEAVVAVVIAWD